MSAEPGEDHFNHATFDYEYSLWGTLGLIIAASILMHGVLVTPALNKLGRRYRKLGIVSDKANDEAAVSMVSQKHQPSGGTTIRIS